MLWQGLTRSADLLLPLALVAAALALLVPSGALAEHAHNLLKLWRHSTAPATA